MPYKILAAIFLMFAQKNQLQIRYNFFSGVEESPRLTAMHLMQFVVVHTQTAKNAIVDRNFKVTTWKNCCFLLYFAMAITTSPDESSLLSMPAPKPNLLSFSHFRNRSFFFSRFIQEGRTFIGLLRCETAFFSTCVIYTEKLRRRL